MSLQGLPFFSSWSGGKDACLALYRAVQAGGRPRYLLTTFEETGERTRAHHLPAPLMERQAAALGLPLVTRPTTWDNYEQVFLAALSELKGQGVGAGVFGDIDLQEHRDWVEKICAAAGLQPFLPLWQEPRAQLLQEFLMAGFQATIIAVREDVLSRDFLGRTLDQNLVEELTQLRVDPCGEAGEYHTVVTAGPLFAFPLRLHLGDQVQHYGYWFQEVASAE